MYYFIANGAKKRRTRAAVKKIEEIMRERGLPYVIRATEKEGHGIALAREISEKIARESFEINAHDVSEKNAGGTFADVIIAVGGDGTFSEVVNGADVGKVPLGFIPAGTGNDFAKTAGFSLKPKEALEDILTGKTVQMDYILIGDGEKLRRCLNVAGTGLDVDVLKLYARAKKKTKARYFWCLIKSLFGFKGYKVKMLLDGVETEHDCFAAAVGNGQYFGGGMKVSPQSDIYDGQMDVVIVHMVKKSRIPKLLFKFMRGKHIGMDFCETHKCEKVSFVIDKPESLVNVDGELIEGLSFDAKIIAGGLTVFAPRGKVLKEKMKFYR